MLGFKNFLNENLEAIEEAYMIEEMNMLYEKLVVFGGGAKYGQIVFMSGGAGSGKGFASKSFMESEKFKIRDVDEWKKAFLALAKLKGRNPEIANYDLRNPKDVGKLHLFVKNKRIHDKSFKNITLDLLLSDLKADRLPNIIFDITGKDISDFQDSMPYLMDAGYDPKNIHLAWVLTDFKVSYTANVTRDRVVPADVFLDTHKGASKTMQYLLDNNRMPRGADGRFVVILNNRDNTIVFKTGETYKGGRVDLKNQKKIDDAGVQGFYYLTVKDAGKPFRPESSWKEELHNQIVKNVPGGQDSIDTLRKSALEDLAKVVSDPSAKEKDRTSAQQGIELIKRDAAVDRIEKKLKAIRDAKKKKM
jgi:hypothetical protein